MEQILIGFVSQYPVFASVLMIIGVARAINKPLFVFLRAYVSATPSKKDDELLDQVEHSKAYSYIVFLLDYVASVKLPGAK